MDPRNGTFAKAGSAERRQPRYPAANEWTAEVRGEPKSQCPYGNAAADLIGSSSRGRGPRARRDNSSAGTAPAAKPELRTAGYGGYRKPERKRRTASGLRPRD